jgi:4-diphosphocytidyl-2-C-methyl-D-erythritol kinase
MRILSPAKINLHLRIGPRSADGFHPLLSWMCTVGLHDTIEMIAADKPGIRLNCDRPDVPVDETNLIVRAGRTLDEKRGADVTLQKNAPMGGGLGGGSSNAAFALIGFNQIWNLNLSMNQLAVIGARLGSDVPFFLHGPSSVCAGRGERVTPLPKPAAKFAVLFFPKLSMSTAAVYRRFDEMKLGSHEAITRQPDWIAWTKLPVGELLRVLVNDLEVPAFSLQPELGELRRHIERRIGRIVRMTGSGSTLFTLTHHRQEAAAVVAEIRRDSINAEVFELAPDLAAKSDLV